MCSATPQCQRPTSTKKACASALEGRAIGREAALPDGFKDQAARRQTRFLLCLECTDERLLLFLSTWFQKQVLILVPKLPRQLLRIMGKKMMSRGPGSKWGTQGCAPGKTLGPWS